ncbi:MAG: hypothetical protein BWY85_00102 [Firmicutes bacterium ADurb.Bin506]|nr:MAG: hypothetical protein BWY85_00102 [Firmicutes bacterium ADurb.Bin506]
MPSPIRSGGDPAPINPGSADAVSDLPASQWPSMERIAVVDLVGPGAANRQVRALQRRTRVLADNLNRNTAVLNYVSGYAAVPGDYARKVQAAGTVPLAAGPAQVADDLEHYLARDGSSVMWGRLNLGHTRSLMFTSAFDTNANHWVQGPGSADVALADADRIWGIKRLATNDYELYVWRLSNPYRVLTTYDFPAGPTSFLASGSNNDRLVTTAGGASLFVEASYAATDTPAKLGVAITGQSSLYLRALKGNAAFTDICREGTSGYNGTMMRFEGSQATRAYPFIYTTPISVSAAFGYGIAIGHAPHGTPTEWGATDYSAQAVQSAYAEPLRFAFATRQSVMMGNGDSTLSSGAAAGANSCISVWSPGTSTSRPSYGFGITGVSQASLYYDGLTGDRPELKVLANGGGTYRVAYREDLAAVAFSGAYSDLVGAPAMTEVAYYGTPGTYSFSVPAASTTYYITIIGGGGGGGAGGDGVDGASFAGASGGNSSFGSTVAYGGTGGAPGTAAYAGGGGTMPGASPSTLGQGASGESVLGDYPRGGYGGAGGRILEGSAGRNGWSGEGGTPGPSGHPGPPATSGGPGGNGACPGAGGGGGGGAGGWGKWPGGGGGGGGHGQTILRKRFNTFGGGVITVVVGSGGAGGTSITGYGGVGGNGAAGVVIIERSTSTN